MASSVEHDFAQDLATDCSVVASLCAASRHFQASKGKGSMLASLMYPFHYDAMRPAVSASGRYVFRLYFNGCWRRVEIDDRLPSSSSKRRLYVVDQRNPQLIWPALVEKAYLKTRGGYDFPGSNSGTDLHVLTGWIPEQIFVQSEDVDPDEIWKRIKIGFDDGNALVTLGTGKISAEEEETLGLAREHDYAVLDLKQHGSSSRLFLVKNPWCDSLAWTGVGSSATGEGHEIGASSQMTNAFWMPFEDVLQHFDSLYVNWNPASFSHRQDHHFVWKIPEKTEDLVFTHNPQYSLLSTGRGVVWVLLSRHWQDGELEILKRRKTIKNRLEGSLGSSHEDSHADSLEDSLATMSERLGFMALSVFASSPPGSRIPLPEGHQCMQQGPYVDSPNTLLRLTARPGRAQTLVIAQGELPLPTYSFTLSFFSTSPLVVSPASSPLACYLSVPGSWTRRTAGGSASHPSYFSNPQFILTVPRPTPLSLLLSTDVHHLPIHIALLFSSGRRVYAVAGRDVLAASPEYQRGCTLATVPRVEPGTYAVVASTFEPGSLARFVLRIGADCNLELRPVPPDAAGRLRTIAPRPAVFASGIMRLRARLGLTRLTRLAVAARAADSPAVRLSLETESGPDRVILAASGDGDFADAAFGLRTAEVDLEPDRVRVRGGLWVVVELIGGGARSGRTEQYQHEHGVQVEVLSDGPVQIGRWESM